MSKFLKLVVENTPSEGRGSFVVEYKDGAGNLMAILTIPDNVGSSYERFLEFAKEVNGVLEVPKKAKESEPLSPEDNEQVAKAADAATKLLSIPDQGAKSLIPGTTASKVQKLKRALVDKLRKNLKSGGLI